MNQITSFTKEYAWLSNFWMVPIVMGEFTFPSNEHAYQAAKSTDPHTWEWIINCVHTPGAVKRFGRTIALRPDWESIKLAVMAEITAAKYDQHPALKEKLLATKGMELIEGNYWHDTYWGVCKGIGENHLGKILMAYRERQL